MPQAVWTGAISFGLVSIPVRLYPATEPKDVRFHLYDRATGRRVRYERVTRDEEPPLFLPEPDDDADAARELRPAAAERRTPASHVDVAAEPAPRVDTADIVRGFELPTGDLVTVTDDELRGVAPERSRNIEIEEFVDLAQIDPMYFEKSYYVAPGRGVGADKPYALLLRAMQQAKMVAIGRFVLRTRPHLVAIRALDDALALETLFFGDEVRAPRDIVGPIAVPVISDREIQMAQQLIRALATQWLPEKHADEYREELLALLRGKAPRARSEAAAPAATAGVDELMAQLKASVDAAKTRGAALEGHRTRTRNTRGSRAG